LLRPWISRFTMIISAWWLRTSSKFSGKKSKKQLRIRYSAHWRHQKFWLRGTKWKIFMTLFWWRHLGDVMAMTS